MFYSLKNSILYCNSTSPDRKYVVINHFMDGFWNRLKSVILALIAVA